MNMRRETITNDVVYNGFIYYNLTNIDKILDVANSVKVLGINNDIEIVDDIDYLIIMRELFRCLINGDKFNNNRIYDTVEEFRYYEPDILKDLEDFDNTLDIIENYHGKFTRDAIVKELNNEKEYIEDFRYNKVFKNKYNYADALIKALEDNYNM